MFITNPLLLNIMFFIEICAAIWFFFRWKRSTIQQRMIIVYLVIAPIIVFIEVFMSSRNIRNLWVSHIATLLEFVLILSACYLWKSGETEKRIILFGIIAYIILWTISKFTIESFNMGDTYTGLISKTIEIIAAAWVLFDVIEDTDAIIKTDPRVWFASGIILYASGTLFLFASFNMMLDASPELIKTLWPINWILSIVLTLLLARGVWCRAAQ